MHYTKIVTIFTLLAASAFAAPAANAEAHDKPNKPNRPRPSPGPVQTNNCNNGANPYCCNTDNEGRYTKCYSNGSGGSCSATATQVCCNANNSIQFCLGNVVIE